jgi:polysaccharide export outer membrane protein
MIQLALPTWSMPTGIPFRAQWLSLFLVAMPTLVCGQEFWQSRGPGKVAGNVTVKSSSAGGDRFGYSNPVSATSQQARVRQEPEFRSATEFCEGSGEPYKMFRGVDESTCRRADGEPGWFDAGLIPWEAFAWGEYVGPHRAPHVPRYRVRVNDQIEFVFQLTREQSVAPYRLMVGDTIEVTSTADEELNQKDIQILSDGSISLRLIGRVMAARKTLDELQQELNERYGVYFATDPSIVVRGISTNTRTQDLIDSVDARFGSGGQSRLATVSPDGTVQLPWIGSIPAIGLTLEELRREVNTRYRREISGFEVTPILSQRAPRFVYVLGEVQQPGRIELTGPTSAMQSIALAGGWNPGGNLRQIVVFRRDENWRLMAVRLDLAGGLQGKRPAPADEIWLRDSDIVLVPKAPIQRLADAVDLYFTKSIYGVFPTQFNVDGLTNIR